MLNKLFSNGQIVMLLGETNCYWGNFISGSVLNRIAVAQSRFKEYLVDLILRSDKEKEPAMMSLPVRYWWSFSVVSDN